MPSDLDVVESSEINFESESIGAWRYLAFGQGIPPTIFEEQKISGTLNKDSSVSVNFRNPFKDAITVTIELLADDESANVFQLLLKKNKVTVGGLTMLQIPVSFLPKAISDYYAEVVVQMNEKIKWTFPLKGITESYSTSGDYFLKTKCRVSKKQELKINLPGNPYVDDSETYSMELAGIPKEYEGMLTNSKWIKFRDVKNTLSDPADYLIYEATFAPLKPFKTVVELTISKQSGGRWK